MSDSREARLRSRKTCFLRLSPGVSFTAMSQRPAVFRTVTPAAPMAAPLRTTSRSWLVRWLRPRAQ